MQWKTVILLDTDEVIKIGKKMAKVAFYDLILKTLRTNVATNGDTFYELLFMSRVQEDKPGKIELVTITYDSSKNIFTYVAPVMPGKKNDSGDNDAD